MRRIVVVLLLLTGCATAAKAPPPPRMPQWSSMPASVLDAFCSSFRDEGISSSTTVNVVKTAQPLLITPTAMQALSDSFFYHGPMDPARAAAAATADASEIPIAIPPGCAWRGVAAGSRSKYIDTLTLELSPPIMNPFTRNAAGIFARVALADESPSWYWLPLSPHGDTWAAGRITLLPYRQ